MRVKHSLLNISAGLANQFIITALSFVSRTVFINSLGMEYLGINALFTSLLAMLSLAEAGIGSSIVYNLYKPVADNNKPQILALMRLYKNAYRLIALVVLLLGLAVFPFLPHIIKDTSVDNIELIYFIFLFNTALPYLFIYKHSYLNVNQKNYIVTAAFSTSSIISTSSKIAILYWTENYLLYLMLECVVSNLTTIWVAKFVDRKYPFLKEKATERLDPDIRAMFFKNMKAILIANIGSYFVFGVESLLISSFVSLIAVSLYANYKMLIDISRTFLNQIFGNMYNSMGNLVAQEGTEKIYSIYRVTQLLSFWLYSLFGIVLLLFVNPFITIWLGDDFLLKKSILAVLIVVFYERGMRNAITMVKTTAGIFHEDRYVPILQAIINLGVSLLLVHYLGLLGIFLGGLTSALAIPFWSTPYLVYKKIFNKPLISYYLTYFYYLIVAVVALIAAYGSSYLIDANTFVELVLKALIGFGVTNALYVLIFHRSEEFIYIWKILSSLLNRLPIRYLTRKKRMRKI